MAKAQMQRESGPTSGLVHFVLQGKGGVGKSVIAGWIAEYLQSKGVQTRCIDADPVNRSMSQFAAFNAEVLGAMDLTGQIDRRSYDSMIESLVGDSRAAVVDTGATSFLPLWSYVAETGMDELLRENGRRALYHCVIAGGDMLMDTMSGFDTIAAFAPEQSVMVWLNSYHGKIEHDGIRFEDSKLAQKHASKILGAVTIKSRAQDTFGQAISDMRKRKLTFAEFIPSADCYLVDKQRLAMVRRDIWGQLEALGVA